MRALVTWTWLALAAAVQIAPPPAQDAWLNGFEGAWVVDNARGDDAAIVLTITRDGSQLLLRSR